MARRPHFFVSGEVSHEIVRGTTTGDHGSFQAALIERGADCSRGTQDLSDYLCGVGIRGGWSCDGKPSQPVCLYGGRAIGWGGRQSTGVGCFVHEHPTLAICRAPLPGPVVARAVGRCYEKCVELTI